MLEVLVSIAATALLAWVFTGAHCHKGVQQPDIQEYGPEVDNIPMGEDL